MAGGKPGRGRQVSDVRLYRLFTASLALVLVAGLLQVRAASVYYGFAADPALLGTNAVESTIVPLNYEVLRLTQPDAQVRYFYRDRADPDLLLGEEPWCGYSQYGRTVIRTHDDFKGGNTEFEFYNGTLRRMSFGPEQIVVKPVKHPPSETAIPALWMKRQPGMVDEVRELDIWEDAGRLRIPLGGFVNPNKTAAVFMELAVVFLALLLFLACRRRFVWAALTLPLLGLMVWLLFQTQSRGCFLGLVAGCAVLMVGYLRGFLTVRRLVCLALFIALVVGVGLVFGGPRYTSEFLKQDARTDRLTLWAAVPRMMSDAPGGWGCGNAGRAYVDWYQAMDMTLAIAEFQNSHFTWLVEMGNSGRVGYVFAWLFLISVLTMVAVRDRRPLPLALFAALGLAACFTHELEEPLLWILPAGSLLPLLMKRPAIGWRMVAIIAGVSLSCAIGGIVAVHILSAPPRGVAIHGACDHVFLGGKEPKIWIVDDDVVLDGGFQIYTGKELRRFCEAQTNAVSIGFTRQLAALPDKVDTLVLAGTQGLEYLKAFDNGVKGLCHPQRLVFLSPPFTWKRIGEDLRSQTEVRVILGRLAGRLSADYDLPPPWVKQVPGAELYVPNWLSLVTESEEKR